MLALSVVHWHNRTTNRRRRLLLWMGAVSAISFALSYYLTDLRQPWAFFSSPTRAWEFAVGAFAVLLPQKQAFSWSGVKTTSIAGWAGLGGILVAVLTYGYSMPYPGIAAILPVLSTVLVLGAASSSADNAMVRMLSIGPFQEIGRLSYSWYLWHWPVLVLGSAIVLRPSLSVRASLVVLSLGLAAASYRFVENPIRQNRTLASRNGYSIAMAGALAFFGIGMSLAWRTASSAWMSGNPVQVRITHARSDSPIQMASTRCMPGYYEVNVQPCAFGAENSSVSVVLFGDSHAVQWFSALESISSKNGWRLMTMTKSACALVEAPYFYPGLGRIYNECAEWRKKALQEIGRIRPALTVMASTVYYDIQDAAWRDGISTVVNDVAESSQRVLILKDTPRPSFDVPTCLGRREWRPSFIPSASCQFKIGSPLESRIYEFQELAAGQHQNVLAADVSSSLCPHGVCVGEFGEVIIYRDDNHLTSSAAMSLQPLLSEQIERVMAGFHTKPK